MGVPAVLATRFGLTGSDDGSGHKSVVEERRRGGMHGVESFHTWAGLANIHYAASDQAADSVTHTYLLRSQLALA